MATLQKSGVIKLDDELQDIQIWQLISDNIIPPKTGKAIFPLTENKQGKTDIEIQKVISPEELPFFFGYENKQYPQFTVDEITALQTFRNSMMNIFDNIFEKSWILIGVATFQNNKILPILILHIPNLNVNWFSVLEINQKQALMQYHKNLN